MRHVILLLAVSSPFLLEAPAAAQSRPPTAGNPAAVPAGVVYGWYVRFLNREPDPQGMSVLTNALSHGVPDRKVLASMLGSQEYYLKAGGTPDGFIRTLFGDLLGRQPTSEEFSYWMLRMRSRGPAEVAYAMLRHYRQGWRTDLVPFDYNRDRDRPYPR